MTSFDHNKKILIIFKIIPFSIFSMQCSRPGMIYGIAICIFRKIQPKFQQKFANIMAFSTKSIFEKKTGWKMCFGSLHIMLNTHLGILNITQNIILQGMSCCYSMCTWILWKDPSAISQLIWCFRFPWLTPWQRG